MFEEHHHQQEQGQKETVAQDPGPQIRLKIRLPPGPDRHDDHRAENGQRREILEGKRPLQGFKAQRQRWKQAFARSDGAVASTVFDERDDPAPRRQAIAREQRGHRDKRDHGHAHEREEATPRR